MTPRAQSVPLLCSLCVFGLLFCLAFPAWSDGAAGDAAGGFHPVFLPQLQVGRAPGPIVIDGELDDPGWQGAASATGFVEHAPGDQVQPPVDTVVFITYDWTRLYVAFLCKDDPLAVRASLTERDRIWQDDYVILLLDTYGDQSWAYEIAVNPLGVPGDLLWSPTGGEDMTYDLVFESAGKLNGRGYQVEMAIPFASLRFPDRPSQEWRVDFWRNHPRQVRGQYSWAAYDRDESCWPCQWGVVRGIAGVSPGHGLQVMPAMVGSQAGFRDEAGQFTEGRVDGQLSLGAGYSLSSNLVLETTYNPDFSQVEADVAEIDVNTTFALYFPEKRPFFQEGSDLFQTNFDVFYSRSVNDPRLAAKLTGRPGRTSVAYLFARDEHTPFQLPFAEETADVMAGRSTVNVLRVQHAFGNQSHIGLIGTDRRLDKGGSGSALGLDGRIRLDQNHQFEWQVLSTFTEEPDDTDLTAAIDSLVFGDDHHTSMFDGESFRGHGVHASFERSARRWSFDLDYWERSPTFRVDNGFEPRNDQRLGNLQTDYTIWFENSVVEWVDPSLVVARMWDFAGLRQDEWVRAALSARFKLAQTYVSADYMVSNEIYRELMFADIFAWETQFETSPAEWLRCGAFFAAGHRIARTAGVMGKERYLNAWLDLKPMDRVLLETQLRSNHSQSVDTGQKLFGGTIARTKLSLQISRELSTRLVLQFNDYDRLWELDPLITYRLSPFSIFYVGSTRDWQEFSPADSGDRRWRLADRQYFLKLQYLFQI
jgi:hypothetical protein